jgi:hypothetical protein
VKAAPRPGCTSPAFTVKSMPYRYVQPSPDFSV